MKLLILLDLANSLLHDHYGITESAYRALLQTIRAAGHGDLADRIESRIQCQPGGSPYAKTRDLIGGMRYYILEKL